ncbi:hypothetical protein RND81_01G172700 [Saponaria officinalis]|uniref:F-box domain-containing protein n=1 Tax=Saponaria officinalis TaxID=3572 RepID=A0AAW1N8A2_SAPOF
MLSKCNKIMHNSEGINATNCKDRLSELPDEVIVHILSFLPTVDAIRTMLIRCFRNLWTFVPTLKFDLDAYTNGMIRLNRCDDLWTINPLFGSEIQEYYDIHYSSDSDSGVIFWVFPRFSRFVRNVLTLHKGPTIDTFHISIDQFPDDLFVQDVIDDVQTWLTFAIDKGVQNLNFDFDSHDAIIPQCVFTSHSLVTLSLSDVKLEDQTQVHLRNLRKLSLFCVCGSDRAFQQLISGCPSLLELTIDNAIGMQILNVTSQSVSKLFLGVEDDPIALNTPALKMLDVVYPSSSSSYLLKVIDVSSLQEVNAKNLPCYGDQVTTFFSQFLSVEVFTLSHHSFSVCFTCSC